jgi:transposase
MCQAIARARFLARFETPWHGASVARGVSGPVSAPARGFVVLPRHWVAERTFSWFGRNRRLAKDW